MRLAMILFGLVLASLPASAQDKKRPDVLNISETGVFGLAFSPDGKMLAAGAVGRPPLNELKVWDAESWELKTSFTGHTNHISHVAFSPDGKMLATGSFDSTVRLWDVETGKEKSVVLRQESRPLAVRFSNDGKTLGVATHKHVHLLDVASGKAKSVVGIHPTGWGHCFNPTLELMAFMPDWWYVHLIDTSNGKTKILLTGLKGDTRAMTFSGDGKTLALSTVDDVLRVWDVAAAKQTATFNVENCRCIALSKDGRYVALGTREGKVRIWDIGAKKELPALQDKSLSIIFSVAFSPDSKTLAAGGMGKVRLWSLAP